MKSLSESCFNVVKVVRLDTLPVGKRGRKRGSVMVEEVIGNGESSLKGVVRVVRGRQAKITPQEREARVNALVAFYASNEETEVSPFKGGELTLQVEGIGPASAPQSGRSAPANETARHLLPQAGGYFKGRVAE